MNRKITYPVIVSFLFGFFCFLFALNETHRIAPEFQSLFVALKMIYGVIGVAVGVYFYFFGTSDASFAFIMTIFATYILSHMWLAPLYEIAYLELALACSFFRLRRNWIFPVILFTCLVGMIATYVAQDRMGWVLPAISRSDWYATIVIFFLLSWFIHKYAIGSYQKENEQLLRFGVIGQEATRLTHDIKGLLSSPLIIVDALRNNRTVSAEDFERQMVHLANDMDNIREVIKSIHRLVNVDDRITTFDLTQLIHGPLSVLERRLARVQINLPERRLIQGNSDRLHSIFFNLFLNSVEAFEKNKVKNPTIDIFWKESTLVFRDNAGGIAKERSSSKSGKSHGSGLGLGLVKADLERIGVKFKIKSIDQQTQIEMTFGPGHLIATPNA